jgi:putative hydrolase of the HAD superfamily
MTVITTLILDLDGVIRHWDGEALEAASMAIGLERGVLFEIAFDEALMQQSMTGVITAETWEDEITRRVAGRSGLEPAAVAALWNDQRWAKIDGEVLDVVDAVRGRGRRVALFSNATTRLERDLDRLGVSRRFDVIVNSARLGIAKPDPRAFTAAARLVDVVPSECVFVDDRAVNVDGAREAGMRAEVYAGVDALRDLLVEVGLLDERWAVSSR